ncbi:surface protein (macronuclear) [Tetrahymena thermophila SB210]|uniref:Surface protein n=1 Tax=Tetrahymena thermophila (strain SB210) TaxID=312017 RepID=Q234V1_TETTS|nr:surface protein [Tetrahymena thermophila SB210]EAR91902.2 surface protein [Tetrahymena thermophila SB210]|eukprot:XP_001012147.2 surface protein [Tetrahymena thermophila SB210]
MCEKPCVSCTSQKFCTICVNNLIPRSDGSCGCQDGQYQDTINQKCIQCDESCGTCSSSSFCNTCASGFEQIDPGVCVRKCPTNSTLIYDGSKYTCQCNKGYFPVLNSLYQIVACNQCPNGCSSCTDSKSCQTCIDGFYKNTTTCQQCSPTCLTCTYLNVCQTCQLGYYLESSKCVKCDISCKTCVDSKNDNCTSCFENFTLIIKTSTYGVCVKSCNKNEVFDNNYNCICSPLYLRDEKNVCQQIQPDGTIICGPNYFFEKDSQKCLLCIRDIQQNIPCVTSCKKEQYFDNINLTCSQCLPEYGNKCQHSCSKNEYMDNIGICRLCHKSCSECKGPLESDCLSCTNQLVFQPTLKKCAQCEEGQFYNEIMKSCDYCDYTCLVCSGKNADQCILCSVGLYFSPVSNKCLKQSEYNSEQEQIKQLQTIGCILDNQQAENNDCKNQFDSSQFLNKILEILSIINITLAFFSSIFTSSGSIISWISLYLDEQFRAQNKLCSSHIYDNSQSFQIQYLKIR